MTHDQHTGGSAPLVYQSALPVSRATLDLVTDLIRQHRRSIGSRWRKVTPGRHAILALAWLRHDQRLTDLAVAQQVSASTIRRWALEVLPLLAARAPRLDRVLPAQEVVLSQVVVGLVPLQHVEDRQPDGTCKFSPDHADPPGPPTA